MFYIEPTPKNTGIILWGDFFVLQELHQLTYKCWESPFLNNEGLKDILFALSYDIRKAYEGHREQNILKDFHDKDLTVYGVKISWILILVACSFMRTSLAYCETTKKDQAIMYFLESYLEQTVQEIFVKDSKEIIDCCKAISNYNQNFIKEKFSDREIYFLNLNSKVKRRNELKSVLQSFLGFSRNENNDLSNGLDYPKSLEW